MNHEFKGFSGENIIHTLKSNDLEVAVTGFCRDDMRPGDTLEIHQWTPGKHVIKLTIISVEKTDHKGIFKDPNHGKNAKFNLTGRLDQAIPVFTHTQSEVPPRSKKGRKKYSV